MADDDYAIVVGINAYKYLDPLAGAELDALRFADWLSKGGQVPAPNVELILSSEQKGANALAHPIKWIVDQAFQNVVPGKKRRGRRLYFYFSGHGCMPDVRDTALLMADAANDTMNLNIGADVYRNAIR